MSDPERSSPIEIEDQLNAGVSEKETAEKEQKWGRVLICGGTTWASNGKKDRPTEVNSDLIYPQILRSICHIRVVKIITGPAANYAAAIDIHGIAYLFGRLPSPSLAPGNNDVVSEHKPVKLSPRSVGLPRGAKWVGGAAARSHLLLVASDGTVWGIGNNVFGQLGLPPGQEINKWTKVTGPWTKQPDCKIVQATAGHTFSLYLTNTGQIFASGSSEGGQLGNGKTGERLLKSGKTGYDIEAPPRQVGGLQGKKIVEIASGNQHSLALDDEGYVYAWGYAGYARLGLQDQKDRLVPTIVPQFTGKNELTRAKSVVCGPTSELIGDQANDLGSVVIDKQGLYYMAGKWKTTGDGSSGAPYTSFKTIHDSKVPSIGFGMLLITVMGCRVIKATSGGCTHFLTTPDPEGGTMTVGFGQGCLYGELGLGPDVGKSSTKPVKLEPLIGIDVIDVAAGAFSTYFLVQPNAALTELDRWPQHVKTPDICIVCKIKQGDPLECERCDMPYHAECLDPPLADLPEGEWFCPECEQEMEISPEEEEEMAARDTSPVKAGMPAGRGKSGTPVSRAKSGPASKSGRSPSSGSGPAKKGGKPSGLQKGSPSKLKRKAEDEGGRPKSKLKNVTVEDRDEDE